MTDKTAKILSLVSAADLATGQIVEMVEKIFHVEDMFTLAKKNSFVALNFFQLVCNIDYCLISPNPVTPVGTSATGLAAIGTNLLGIEGGQFTNSPMGKLAAVAECFKIQAAKMNDMITTDTISSFMQGTGAAQIAQDAVNALLSGGIMLATGGAGGVAGAAKSAVPALPAVAGMVGL